MLPFYLLALIAVVGLSSWGSRMVEVSVAESPIPRGTYMVIDAGHGGPDGGATSCTGVLESELNLQIALRLEQLSELLGIPTLMIRREDISVYTTGETIAQKKVSDLKERVRIVNETENAVLLSIHQNQFPDSRYSGPQVFFHNSEDSIKFATQMQTALTESLAPDSRRQIKPAKGIYLMEHIQKPGILIECGFLSNPAEEARLRDAEYQKKLCAVIATSVGSFLSNT
jgi:N-acetylmuramoyl-L-alanine amidase